MTASIASFGKWVRERRKQRGLTQKALGQMVGYAEITVRQIEKDSYALTRFVVECFVNCLAQDNEDRDTITQFVLIRPFQERPSNLHAVTHHFGAPFIGREAELDQINSLLRNPECRCISIVGVGGIGKTRLATRVIDTFAHESEYEIHFINLTGIATQELMARAIAGETGIALNPFTPISTQLLEAFKTKRMVLVLDNFEQLLIEGKPLVNAILEQSPSTKLIITSRERLQISYEWSIRLQGLEIVNQSSLQDAVRLFINTAQRVNNHFIASDLDTIQSICRTLQGIPLAIEMAASWTELYSNSEILSSISTKLFTLAARHTDVDERHKSLSAVFETTWERLPLCEQETLKQLAVFRGGFTLDAAQQIVNVELQLFAYLQDKMLIQPQHEGRIVLHELVRQFAYQKLEADQRDLSVALSRHANYFIALLHEKRPKVIQGDTHNELANLLPEIDNIHLTWQTMLSLNRYDWFLKCWECVMFLMNNSARFHEGEELFKSAAIIFRPNKSNTMHKVAFGIAQSYYSWFLFRQGRIPEAYAEQFIPELDFIRENGDLHQRSWVHIIDSFIYHGVGNAQTALNSALQSLAVLEQAQIGTSDQYRAVIIYFQLARSEQLLGNLVSANHYFIKALEIGQKYKIPTALDMVLTELGYLAEDEQDYQKALNYYEKVLSASATSADLWNYQRTLISIGRIQFALGAVAQAIDTQLSVLHALNRNPMFGLEIDSYVEIAQILNYFGDHVLADALLNYCSNHPECFQPTRDRAKSYLTAIHESMKDIVMSKFSDQIPLVKSEVTNMLLERLTQIHNSHNYLS